MNEDRPVKILPIPKCMHPIMGIHDQITEEPETPFFGFAPGETPVRIVTCPECNQVVNAAHFLQHQKSHDLSKQEPSTNDESFHIPSHSVLIPPTPCPYADRQTYAFRALFEENKK